jgi:NADH-quinone oxidoreductase subunit H
METLGILLKILIVVGGAMTCVGYFVLLERWIAAWVQDRRGPNRAGIPLTNISLFGLGQPLADGVKMLFKESYIPGHVNYVPYLIAPVIIMGAALASFAVVPFGAPVDLSWLGIEEPVHLQVAPLLDVGLIYMFALSGLAVYGVIVGGWSSNNKYSFLGGLRASAQLIAYEIPLGLGILGVVFVSGSLGLADVVNHQAASGVWNIATQPLGFLVFFVAAMAEAARLPFDLPESEQELVAGYHTEYGGMKLLTFLAAEFLHMITAAVLIVLLFLGGWHFWGVPMGLGEESVSLGLGLAHVGIFLAKCLGVVLLFMLIRWSWPRFRFDQLMGIAWIVAVPLGMLNILLVVIASELARLPSVQDTLGPMTGVVLWGFVWVVAIASLVIVSVWTAQEKNPNPKYIPGGLD